VPGGDDALGLHTAQLRQIFPRVIARYVREQRVLTLEDAIRKMTSWRRCACELPIVESFERACGLMR